MKKHAAPEARATTDLANSKLSRPKSQFDKLRKLEEAIACRAYELFESRGRAHGQDSSEWLRAESEILQPLQIKVSEYQDRLAVKAEVPGFTLEEVEVSAEPQRLIISGRTRLTDQEAKNTFSREILDNSTEILPKHTFHQLDLPVEIDADKVEATLTAGILTVTLPKLIGDKALHAQTSAS